MKLVIAFNIIAQAVQSSNKLSLTACDGQCPGGTCTITRVDSGKRSIYEMHHVRCFGGITNLK